MKILFVEDEIKPGETMHHGLKDAGFIVDCVKAGSNGLTRALRGAYDLIVLDVKKPHLNGWKLLLELRAAHDAPLLFLTAREAMDNQVSDAKLGVDDYMIKSFSFMELMERVRILLRRECEQEPKIIEISDILIDVSKRCVLRNGRYIDLTRKQFSLLHLLAKRSGEALSRSLIAAQVWGANFDGDTNVVDVAVCRLRAKLDDHYPQQLIRTVRGMGYVLEDKK